MLWKTIDHIQNDNDNGRNDIKKYIGTICKEEGIPFEQVFYILFLML